MTVFLFIAVLFVLILVHELGHFVTAKWARMRVDEFGIGFPPRLFAIKKGETEYAINLLPIGGYVKIFGENGSDESFSPVPNEERDHRSERSEAGEGGPNGSEAENESRTLTTDSAVGHTFGSRPRYQQAIVLLAGVFMNILTAWVIFFAVAMIGTPTAVNEENLSDSTGATLRITTILPDSPAKRANIPLGAIIKKVESGVENLDVLTPSAFSDFIVANADTEVTIYYDHKKSAEEAVLLPEAGLIEEDPSRKAIGLSTALVSIEREEPLEALLTATTRTYHTLIAITIGVSSFLASAFTLSADVSQVTGPIGIAGMVGDAAEFGFVSLLVFTAFISLNLAVINLLPIPALDGGRLLFVLAEAIIRRPIDPEWMGRVNFIGFALLILLMIAVTYNDILRIL